MENAKTLISTLPVTDQNRADTFYKEVLGFKDSNKEMPGGTLLIGPGEANVFLYETEASSGDATRISIAVSDFDVVIEDLSSKGVEFESYDDMPGETEQAGIYEYEGAKVAWFKDTEGNVINLFSE